MGLQSAEQAMLQAAKKGDIVSAKQAVLSGINLELSDDNGKTPLLRAAKYGNVEIIKLLLQHQANIASVAKDGRNVLHVAAAAGHDHVIKCLLNYGASDLIDETDNEGRKPSDVASKKNKSKVLDMLHEAALSKQNNLIFQEQMKAHTVRQSFDLPTGKRPSFCLSAIKEERDSTDSRASSRPSLHNVPVSPADRRPSTSDLSFSNRSGNSRRSSQSSMKAPVFGTFPTSQAPSGLPGSVPGYVDPRTFQPISSSLQQHVQSVGRPILDGRRSMDVRREEKGFRKSIDFSARTSMDRARYGARQSSEFSRNPTRQSIELNRNTGMPRLVSGVPATGRKSLSNFGFGNEQPTFQRRPVW